MLIYLQMLETDEQRDKFEKLYWHYYRLMFHVAYERLNDIHDTQDAMHEAFLALIKNYEKISDIYCPETRSYIVIITANKAIDIIRRKNKVLEFDESIYHLPVPEPKDDALASAMAKLPPRYREVLLLHYDSGFDTKELAKIYNISRSSVQKLLWRAKAALREICDKEGIGYE